MQKVSAKIVRQAKADAAEQRRLSVSAYDRASSMLMSLLLSIGTAVALLTIIWFTTRNFVSEIAVPVSLEEFREDGEGGGDGRPPGGSQLDTPSDEPFVGTDEKTSDVQEDLTTLTAAVTAKAAELDDPMLSTPTRHGSYGTGGGIYGGFGDGRGWGHGKGRPGRPRSWEILFSRATLDLYARQLDCFGIELGVLMPDNKIVYAFHFTKPKPDTRTLLNPAENEKRFYLTWQRGGDLQQADLELLSRAGIDSGGHLVLKFLPPAVEVALATLEKQWAEQHAEKGTIVKKTRFGVAPSGDKFVFTIVDQTYKNK